MERIIVQRLRTFLMENELLDKHQSGFTPKRSTLDNLLRLSQEINDGFINDEFTVAIFFDLEKAFDKIHQGAIILKLQELNIKGRMLSFLTDFLNSRTFKIRLGNHISTSRIQETGVPQGSVVSPLLFNLVLIGIENCLHKKVNYSLYADDLAIFSRGRNISMLTEHLQQSINKLVLWYKHRGLNFSVAKTKAVIFTRKRIIPLTPNLNLNDTPIPIENTVKFLGILFDTRLN